MSCSDYPTAQTAKTFKLDAETTNEVVTIEQDRTSTASDGKTKKTFWGIENDAILQRNDIDQLATQQRQDIENLASEQRDNFESTFQAQFQYARIGNISDYAGDTLADSEKLNSYQYPDDSDEWYGPIQDQAFPITIPSDPTGAGSGWVLINALTLGNSLDIFSGVNLIGNPSFSIPSNDSGVKSPTSTPSDYNSGDQFSLGWFCDGQVIGLSQSAGVLNASSGVIYYDINKSDGLESTSTFKASYSKTSLTPISDGVSISDEGSYYRVSLDLSVATDVFSVKMESGLYSTNHSSSLPSKDSQEIPDLKNKKMYLGMFFRSNEDTQIDFYTANAGSDGARFGFLSTPGISGRDPNYIYKNGWHMVAVTGFDVGVYDVTIHRSRDLVQWETVRVNLGATPVTSNTTPITGGTVPCSFIWAPDWNDIDGQLYLSVAAHFAPDEPNKDGVVVKYKRMFYSKCADVESLSFEYPIEVNSRNAATQGNTLDGLFYKIGSTYYYLVKNEYEKSVEVHTSSTFDGAYTYQNTLPFSMDVEGPSVYRRYAENSVRIMVDAYNEPWHYFVDTTDFVTYTSESPIQCDRSIRHGHIVRVDDQGSNERIYEDLKTISLTSYEPPASPTFTLTLGSEDVHPVNGAIYKIEGTTQTSVSIGSNNADSFYFLVASDLPEAQIIVQEGGFVDLPGEGGLVIGRGAFSNTLIQFKKTDNGRYKMVGSSDGFEYRNLPAYGGSQDILELKVKDGMVLYTTPSDTGVTRIRSFGAFTPVGTSFTLVTLSGGVNGEIRVDSEATNMPQRNISGANGAQGVSVVFTKVDDNGSTPSGTWINTYCPS